MTNRYLRNRLFLILVLFGVGFFYVQSESIFAKVEETVAATVKQGAQVGQKASRYN